MGNTFFYRDVKNNPNKITLKEILSECRVKHSKRDLEYQLSAGTAINQATEQELEYYYGALNQARKGIDILKS